MYYRSLLFTPAFLSNKLESIVKFGADLVVFDLEDSVHPNKKDEARILLKQQLKNINKYNLDIGVRINAIDTLHGIKDILFIKNELKIMPKIIFIPKVNNPFILKMVRNLLSSEENTVSFSAIIESVKGIENINEIAKESDSLIFGAADYCADSGIEYNDTFLTYAKIKITSAAAINNIPSYDTFCSTVEDLDKVKIESEKSHKYGFAGKAAIHPNQIPIINETFAVNKKDYEEALNLINNFTQQTKGFEVKENKIIAPPFVNMKKRIVKTYLNQKH
ncbi:MAG: CoA ester lyase [Victivallales bacterium]|nr:CoA ester lyase [Victivallales bacterium]